MHLRVLQPGAALQPPLRMLHPRVGFNASPTGASGTLWACVPGEAPRVVRRQLGLCSKPGAAVMISLLCFIIKNKNKNNNKKNPHENKIFQSGNSIYIALFQC